MATGDQYVAIASKRIMGVQDFRERMLDYMRTLTGDLNRVAFGLDGTFDGPISMSGFGANKFQVNTDGIWSDGDGHFLETSALLAGRDIGISFENTNAVAYVVGLHYAERPRSVQINPRSGAPEFVAWEESIGNRAEPDLVVDNGDGTMTFRVNSVVNPFGNNPRTGAGRRVLVWKKTPGSAATTEAAAIESCLVIFGGTHNTITTTVIGSGGAGKFGQTIASTLASDYYVMILGPTVTRNADRDLELEPAYALIGRTTGNGGTPVTFNLTGQNQLGSGFAVDLNAITRLDGHGDLKVRVIADGFDADEPQIEVWSAAMVQKFSVDEDGDMFVAGGASVVGAIDAAALTAQIVHVLNDLTVDDDALIDGSLLVNDQFHAAGTGNIAADLTVGAGLFTAAGLAQFNGVATFDAAVNLNGNNGIGNADTDLHTIKGKVQQRTTGFGLLNEILGPTGEFGLGGAAEVGFPLKVYGHSKLGTVNTHIAQIMSIMRWVTGGGSPTIEANGALGQMHIGGLVSAMGAELLRVTGSTDLRDKVTLGAILNAGTAIQGASPRVDLGNINSLSPFNGFVSWLNNAGTRGVRFLLEDAGFSIACNCKPTTAGADTWTSDDNAVPAVRLQISNTKFKLYYKAATALSWVGSNWTNANSFDMSALQGSGDPGVNTFFGEVVPSLSETSYLGTAARRWIAFLSSLNLGGHTLPSSNEVWNIGSAILRFATVYAKTFSGDDFFADNFTVDAAGDFLWAAPRVFRRAFGARPTAAEVLTNMTVIIPAANVDIVSNTPIYTELTSTAAFVDNSYRALWNFRVPDGVTITEIKLFYRTGSDSAQGIKVQAFRQLLTAPSTKERFWNSTAFNAVSLGANLDLSFSALINTAAGLAAVDNNLYSYWLYFQLTANDANTGGRVYGFEVRYSADAAGR